MNPVVWLIYEILQLYSYALIAYIILGLLISFNVVNRAQPQVAMVRDFLMRVNEPVLHRVRRYMPDLGGVDISPIAVFLLISFSQQVLLRYFA